MYVFPTKLSNTSMIYNFSNRMRRLPIFRVQSIVPEVEEIEEVKETFEDYVKRMLKSRSNLRQYQRKEVLNNQKLLRHFKWFLSSPQEKLDLLVKYRLNTYNGMKHHILYRDPSGKTKGCGCMICSTRNYEYRLKKELNHLIRAQSRLNKLESASISIKEHLIDKYGTNFNLLDLDHNPYDCEIFNKFGSIFRREAIDLNSLKNEKGEIVNRGTIVTVSTPSIITNRLSKRLFAIEGPIKQKTEQLLKVTNFRKSLQQKLF